MKYLLTLALFTLLIASSASAQYLSFGTVLAEWPLLPMPSPGMTFELANGAFCPTGHTVGVCPSAPIRPLQLWELGKLAPAGHFDFNRGHFSLNQQDSTFCSAGCLFEGDFLPYSFGIVPISRNCSQIVASLTGTYNGQPVTADYSQTWCHLPTTQYMGGGELSVVY